MRDKKHISEIIDNYLNDEMSLEERMAFEEKLALDKVLAEKVEQQKMVNEAIYYASLSELKEQVGKDIKNVKYKTGPDISNNLKIIISAIVLSALILAYFVSKNTEPAITQGPDEVHVEKKILDLNQTKSVEKTSDPDRKTTYPVVKLMKEKESILATDSSQGLITNSENQPQKDEEFIPPFPKDSVPNSVFDAKQDSNHLRQIKKTNTTLIDKPEPDVGCNQSFEITSSPSCRDTLTGTISVMTDTPENIRIEINQLNSPHVNGTVKEVEAGIYEVSVKYGKECFYVKQVVVEPTWCPLNQSYSFNPDYGEKWEMRYGHGDEGIFTIFDNLGRVVFENNFGSGNDSWTGIDKNGTIVPLGTYLVLIKYSDGRKEKVELTIIR
ncbi:MAG: gliding motility-associated C-terminal domain-containing protein [Cytophagaceae bacterium]